MGPIRNKLWVGLGVLLVMLGALAASGLTGVYAYRELVKNLRNRADELPLAGKLTRQVADLRVTLAGIFPPPSAEARDEPALPRIQGWLVVEEFQARLQAAQRTVNDYRAQVALRESAEDFLINDFERETSAAIDVQLRTIGQATLGTAWLDDPAVLNGIHNRLDLVQTQAEALPSHLHRQIGSLAETVRGDYHLLIGMNWIATLAAAGLLLAFLYLFYRWIFRPLSALVAGSRRVAGGDFSHRIILGTRDEMAELADALNQMTARFQDIRDDLDHQVQERTRQVVRGEQLASVGFLAAGVAHEINNPLASIAMCAESLESRLNEMMEGECGVDAEGRGARDEGRGEMRNAECGMKDDGRGIRNEGRGEMRNAECRMQNVETLQQPHQTPNTNHQTPPLQPPASLPTPNAQSPIPSSRRPTPNPQSPIILQYLRMIQTEAFRCKEITEKLLDFSRLGNAQRQATELRALVAGVVEMVGHLGKYHDRRILLSPAATADETIWADVTPPEIKQVVLNLITNALDCLEPGGTLAIEVRRRGPAAELIFTDNGCGMTPEVLAHLFEPFFTRKRQGQGTGLGLSISYRIVADHGGTLDAASAGQGRGARFTVTLPLTAAAAGQHDSQHTRGSLPLKENDHRYQAA